MKILKKYEKGIYLGIAVLVLIVSIAAVSYAYWVTTHVQSENNSITSGCLDIQFAEGDNINLENSYPITDSAGQTTRGYTFRITNICTIPIGYDVVLTKTSSTSELSESNLKLNVSGSKSVTTNLLSSFSTYSNNGRVVFHDTLSAASSSNQKGEEKTYTLRLWIKDNAVTASNTTLSNNLTYSGKISVVAAQQHS